MSASERSLSPALNPASHAALYRHILQRMSSSSRTNSLKRMIWMIRQISSGVPERLPDTATLRRDAAAMGAELGEGQAALGVDLGEMEDAPAEPAVAEEKLEQKDAAAPESAADAPAEQATA